MTTEELHEAQRQHIEALRELAAIQQPITREEWSKLNDGQRAEVAIEMTEAWIEANELRKTIMAES